MAAGPSHLYIYQRVMRNIERIGEFAEPFAYGYAPFIGHFAAGAHCNNERKHYENCHGIIDAIAATPSTLHASFDARHAE